MAVTKEELDKYIEAYSHGTPLISDEEYDVLMEEYVKEHGEQARPFTRQKQSTAVNDIVGTLTKAYGVRVPMREGQLTFEQWVNKHNITTDLKLQPKFDGCSVAYDVASGRFFTRGDKDDGTSLDVTNLFQHNRDWIKEIVVKDWIKNEPGWPIVTSAKFEAIMSHEMFHESGLDKMYKRPRDAVAAIMTPPYNHVDWAKYITLVPLRCCTADGRHFIPGLTMDDQLGSMWLSRPDYDFIEKYIADKLSAGASVQINNCTFSIDGVVVSKISDGVVGEQTVSVPMYIDPEYEIAIKILHDVKETKLLRIDFQFGKQGRITPVAIFEPVKFGNVSVDHATLSTLRRVAEMQLRVNDTVRIMYNIVPYFLESYHDGDYLIPMPEKCPICGAKLDYSNLRLVQCKNPNCKGLKLGAIIRHAEKMKMIGMGEGVLTKLYDNEFVTSISDLYDLRKWDDCIAQTPGFGYTSFDNMVKSVDNALKEATLARFLGALPFNNTDEKTWKQIINIVGSQKIIDSLVNGTFVDVMMMTGYIPKIGTVRVQLLIDGYLRNQSEIQELMSWVPEKLKQEKQSGVPFKGKICITGTRDPQVIKDLTEAGYEVGGWYNDVKAVVVPNHSFESEKTRKAKEKNIPIYTIEEVEFLTHT